MSIWGLIVWLIVVIIKIDILLVVMTYFVGIYEARNDPELKDKIGIVEIFSGLVTEILASIFTLFTAPFGYFKVENWFKVNPSEGTVDTPVLLIHPYFGNSAFMWFIAFRLKRAGFTNVFTITLRPRTAGLRYFLQRIDIKVNEILSTTGQEKIAIVGHSMGGLLARMYALENPEKVHAIVTIGAPHKGSKLAVFGIGKCAREMEPGSDIIEELDDKYPECPLLAIWSRVDNLALPQRTAIVPERGNTVNYEAPAVGHAALLFTPSVADAVVGFLKSKAEQQ